MQSEHKERQQAERHACLVNNNAHKIGRLPSGVAANPDQHGGHSRGKESKLQLLLAVLPVLSAALYLVGTAYHESYLIDFGIENSMFPLPLDRVWLYGFTSLMSFGLGPMLSGVLIAVLIFAAVMIAAVLSSIPKVQRIQEVTLERMRAKLYSPTSRPTPALIKLVDKWGVLYFYFAGAFLLIMSLIFAIILSSDAGSKAAQNDKVNWAKGTRRSAAVTVQSEPPVAAFQVTCGSTHCAFWTGRETRLLRHEQIVNFLVYPANKNSEDPSK